MTGSVIMAYDPSQVTDGAQVTVVTGTQFAVNPPSAGSTSTSAPATTTTAPTSGSSDTSTSVATGAGVGFAAPSPTTQKLQPWDPRACPARATPTAPVANPLPG